LFYTFEEIKSCDRKKDEVDFYLKATVFWALQILLTGYEIKNTGTMKEGTMPVPPAPALRAIMTYYLFRSYRICRGAQISWGEKPR